MTTSQSLLRFAALSFFAGGLVCNTAQGQLFRRSGDEQTAANEKAKQANARDGKSAVAPRQPGPQNTNSMNSKTQPNRGVPNSANRSSGPSAQANTNGQANRQNTPYAKSPNNNATSSSQNKVGSGLVNKATIPQSRPQTPGSARTTNSPSVPRSNLSNQGRSNLSGNTQLVPQPPTNFAHQPVSQPSHSQSQVQQSAIDSDNSGQLVTKEGTSPQPSAIEGVANEGSTSNVSEAEIFDRFGIQLSDEEDALWVSNLAASGNGQSAGLNRKDKIVSLGGAPLASKAEFVEIAKLLSVGDQIEIEFERNDKPEKSLIFYGKPLKDQSNEEASIQLEDNNNWSTTPTDPTERLERLVAEQQRVIAELQNRIRQLESQSKTAF